MWEPSYDYLEHHGIDGQKWGRRNGPPYPLDYDDHSAAEKKKNPKTKLDNYTNKKAQGAKKVKPAKKESVGTKIKNFTENHKTATKVIGTIAGVGLAAGIMAGTSYVEKKQHESYKKQASILRGKMYDDWNVVYDKKHFNEPGSRFNIDKNYSTTDWIAYEEKKHAAAGKALDKIFNMPYNDLKKWSNERGGIRSVPKHLFDD